MTMLDPNARRNDIYMSRHHRRDPLVRGSAFVRVQKRIAKRLSRRCSRNMIHHGIVEYLESPC